MSRRWDDWRGEWRWDQDTGMVLQACRCGGWKQEAWIDRLWDGARMMRVTDWLEEQFHQHRVKVHGYGLPWWKRVGRALRRAEVGEHAW